jgi:hypothetical protein
MELEILILKKALEYASFKMLMGISGKDPTRIYKSIMVCKIEKVEGLNFLRKGGVTYVTRQGVF